ncbi:MAG: hypothetical protein HON90_05895 [Halobacteriovoraceae bacterium]|nr:hypothetical protein [Halobacteriovoraceae bacterium]
MKKSEEKLIIHLKLNLSDSTMAHLTRDFFLLFFGFLTKLSYFAKIAE